MKVSNAIYGFKWNEIQTKTVICFSFHMTEWIYFVRWSLKKCLGDVSVLGRWLILSRFDDLFKPKSSKLTKKSNTAMKLLSVNIMGLCANPLEIHIILFEFCLVESLFEFHPQSDIIELFCLGILKVTKFTMGLSKSEQQHQNRSPDYRGWWLFLDPRQSQ